jgi:hypothetical protein
MRKVAGTLCDKNFNFTVECQAKQSNGLQLPSTTPVTSSSPLTGPRCNQNGMKPQIVLPLTPRPLARQGTCLLQK